MDYTRASEKICFQRFLNHFSPTCLHSLCTLLGKLQDSRSYSQVWAGPGLNHQVAPTSIREEKRGFTENSHSEVGVFFPLALHPLIFGEDGWGREEGWRVGVV